MNRAARSLAPLTIVVVALAGVTFGLLALANVFFPGLAAQAGLSLDAIIGALAAQAEAVSALTGLSLATDLILFAAAYVLVCVILWVQAELRTYFANRSHFE